MHVISMHTHEAGATCPSGTERKAVGFLNRGYPILYEQIVRPGIFGYAEERTLGTIVFSFFTASP